MSILSSPAIHSSVGTCEAQAGKRRERKEQKGWKKSNDKVERMWALEPEDFLLIFGFLLGEHMDSLSCGLFFVNIRWAG